MKILHTSDWHIGRYFENESLADDQWSFITWLVSVIKDESVDLLVVAGDIWDKASPRPEAVQLLADALDLLEELGIDAVFISGNHDNAVRLAFRGQDKGRHGVKIFADDLNYPTPYLYEKNGEQLVILPIPFLDPQRFLTPLPGADGQPRKRSHENALADAVSVGRERMAMYGDVPSMVIAHSFVAGSQISDSERRAVGGTDVVSASVFDDFDYVALGHLHRPQTIDGKEWIAYSGTPLPYSFSEEAQKSVRVVEITTSGFESARVIDVPMGRKVKVLKDTMGNLLLKPEYDEFKDYWISVKLLDEIVQEQPVDRLRKRFPHIASLGYANVRQSGTGGPLVGSIADAGREPDEIIADYVRDMQRRDANDFEKEVISTTLRAIESSVDQ